MTARKVALAITAALASVPLASCGSSADARPPVPRVAAQAMPAVQSRPAVLSQPAELNKPTELNRPAERATSPVRQSLRGPLVRIGRVGGFRALVDGTGRALYLFAPDRRGASTCYRGCARAWPPLYGRARAVGGVHARFLGTTVRSDGRTQVTYHGRPLYYFAGDRRPGQARGQGLGGVWYLVDVTGSAIGGGRRPIR